MTDVSEYDYHLPIELIAQHPANPRESAHLMALRSNSNEIIHDFVGNFPSYLVAGDVVVMNNTKVFNARLLGTTHFNQKNVEVFLVKPVSQTAATCLWKCIGKPGKKLTPSTRIDFSSDFFGVVEDKYDDGTFTFSFEYSSNDVITKANKYGFIPIPPYIKKQPTSEEYQTVYAKKVGSVAAPTAGFHLTNNILTQLRSKGVQIVEITLHVGLGTFLPIKSKIIEEHTMHSEWIEITNEACDIINKAKKLKHRIVAIGTTTLRALEGSIINSSTCAPGLEDLQAYKGEVNVFITPGFRFKIVDCLLTNFHLPQSTLLLLVCAFAGKERILNAYQEAIKYRYRFFSFGDAMFLEHLKLI